MPRYLIERPLPGAGDLTGADLRDIAQRSCGVLRELGPEIQWVQSFVSRDAITCVYIAPSERLLREHARRGGFPAERITEVMGILDPTAAEATERSPTA